MDDVQAVSQVLHEDDFLLYEAELHTDAATTRVVRMAAQGREAGDKIEAYLRSNGAGDRPLTMRNVGTVRVIRG